MHRNQRRRIIINPRLQWRLVRDACTVPLVCMVGGAVIVGFLIRMVRAEAVSHQIDLPSLGDLALALWLFVGMSAVVIVYQGIRLSHRIAGPLFRFRVSMNDVLAGDTELKIALRHADYLHETAGHFNAVIQAIADRDREIARLRALAGERGVAEEADPESTNEAAR